MSLTSDASTTLSDSCQSFLRLEQPENLPTGQPANNLTTPNTLVPHHTMAGRTGDATAWENVTRVQWCHSGCYHSGEH